MPTDLFDLGRQVVILALVLPVLAAMLAAIWAVAQEGDDDE